MLDPLNIAAFPLDISLADKEKNIYAVDALSAKMPQNTDIVVLPELFSTGYINDKVQAKQLAEREDGDTITHIKRLAAKYQTAYCGSFLSVTGHMVFNRAFFVEPGGEVTFYDKRHLFCLSEESKICTRGISLPPVIRYRRWNIMMAICYDLRFPAWLRNTPDRRYDLLILPANWPEKRAYAWQHLLIARAIENMAFIVGCNRSGTDAFGDYDNLTYIYDCTGRLVSQATPDFVTATISKDGMDRMRKSLPFLNDEDEFSIKMY